MWMVYGVNTSGLQGNRLQEYNPEGLPFWPNEANAIDPMKNKVQRVFIERAADIEFIDENGGGPGVRLKKPPKKRT